MKDIKPIETKYKGYRFRSRLEARYAVFFDALDIKWEYEKEGFHLPSGSYLPDFWLPDWECWVEVKPEDGITDKAKTLATELCDVTSFPVIVTDGLPKNDFQGIFLYKGFQSCFVDSMAITMQSQYLNLYRLAMFLEDIKEDVSQDELFVFKGFMHAAFTVFRKKFNLPKVYNTKFSFQSFVYGVKNKKPIKKAAIVLQNNYAIVYKKLTQKDFDRAEDTGAMYDGLIRFNLYYPILHCDFQNRYNKIPDDNVYDNTIVDKALTQAKSARFEHGENGI